MIIIYKGDASDFADLNSISISIKPDLRLTGYSAVFSLLGVDKQFGPEQVETKTITFTYTSSETASFTPGQASGTLHLYDDKGHHAAVSRVMVEVRTHKPPSVKPSVIEVQIENAYDYNKLENKPTLNGVVISGNILGGGNAGGGCAMGGNAGANAAITALMVENAKLKADAETNDKLTEVYALLRSQDKEQDKFTFAIDKRLSAIETAAPLREEILKGKINEVAMLANNGITALQCQVNCLSNTVSGITKTVVPIGSVCPQPMALYNSWTAPTTTTTTT